MNASSNSGLGPAAGLRYALVVAGLALAGCFSSSEVEVALITVTASDVEIAEVAPERVAGALTLTVENGNEQSVRVEPCAVGLDRLSGGAWVGVWFPLCTLGDASFVTIERGGVHTFSVTIDTEFGRAPSEAWTSPVGGQYRARVTVFGEGEQTVIVTTQPFTI